MKEKKIGEVNFHHSQGHYEFIFDYGDLYMRENVDWDEDVENCRSEIVINDPKDVLSLNVYIKYTIPNHNDIFEMKKNKINQYKIDSEKHLYTVELLNFTQKEGKFRICEDFWIGYEDTIKKLIKQFKNLKEIYFLEGILENLKMVFHSTSSTMMIILEKTVTFLSGKILCL